MIERILAYHFGRLVSAFKSHISEFMYDVICDQPSTFCVCVQNAPKEHYVVMAIAYSDDKEMMDKLTEDIDKITTEYFTKRYPELLTHVSEDFRDVS